MPTYAAVQPRQQDPTANLFNIFRDVGRVDPVSRHISVPLTDWVVLEHVRPTEAVAQFVIARIQTAFPVLTSASTPSFTRYFEPTIRFYNKLEALLEWGDDWDDQGALAPDSRAVARATDWATKLMRQIFERQDTLLVPNVTANSDGEVVFEWWNDPRKVTLYFTADDTECIKVWGTDIDTEMEDGYADSAKERESLWHFLLAR